MTLIPKLHVSATVAAVSLLLAPHSPAQTRVWSTELLSPASDWVVGMASDSDGNVFQATSVRMDIFGPLTARLSRHDASGELTWIEPLGSLGTKPEGLCSDGGSGAFMVGGTTEDLSGQNFGQLDAWIAHYDALGQRSWVVQMGASSSEDASASAPDGTGGVFVAGMTTGSLGGPNQGDWDGWLARYDTAGNQLWIEQFGTDSFDRVTDVTLDAGGGVIVSCVSNDDLALRRFDAGGAITWTAQVASAGVDGGVGAASDGFGGAFVSGVTDGDLGGQNAGGNDIWLAHFDASGSQTWLRQFGTQGDDAPMFVDTDSTSGVVLGGTTQGSLGAGGSAAGNSWLGRFDSTGNEVWLTQFGASKDLFIVDGTSNQRGGAYVGGWFGASTVPDPVWLARYDDITTETYCSPAPANSTGTDGKMSASGSSDIAANDVTLRADDLPTNSFGMFITSQVRSFVIVTGQPGILCLGSPVGRFDGPGQLQFSGGAGSFSLPIDLTAMPQPTGAVAVQPGETWHFQAWHRDVSATGPTQTFTDGLSVTFR